MRTTLRTTAGKASVAFLAALALSLSAVSPAAAGNRDSRGTDFWLAFPLNADGFPVLRLFITAENPTTGEEITIGGTVTALGASIDFSVTPGAVTTVLIQASAQLGAVEGTYNEAVHVTAEHEVMVYGLNLVNVVDSNLVETKTTDAFLALPTDALGTEYIVLSYRNRASLSSMGTEFAVVASEDGTVVTITPSVTTGFRTAGVPYRVRLLRGHAYHLMNTRADADLSGTLIEADRPVAVFGAHRCAQVPPEYSTCNHLVEQLPPTSAWGTNFAAMPLDSRLDGDTFRVIASTDGTAVRINGGPEILLNRGNVHEQIVDLPAHVTSDRPILVAQYSNSKDFDSTESDPFMMLVPPTDQFLASYDVMSTALTRPLVTFERNFINVVAPDAAIDSITLDGAVLPGSAFQAIGASGFSGLQQAVAPGYHRLTGSLAFGVAVYGFEDLDGYGYPGGFSLDPVARVNAIRIAPEMYRVRSGTEHCVVATVVYDDGTPIPRIWVKFAAAGANSADGSVMTARNGEARFCYTGTAAGEDWIEAGVGSVVSNRATATWFDNEPPDVSAAAPTQACFTDTNHVFVNIGIVGVTDPDNNTLAIAITGITSDEATATVPGAGGEYHSPDAAIADTGTARIRVERAGARDGRVYRIWFDATDGLESVSGSVAVGVTRDQDGGACAVDSGQYYDATVYN